MDMKLDGERKRKGKWQIGRLFWVIVTTIPILGLVWSLIDPQQFEAVQQVWRQRAETWGIAGPVVFVAAQASQVIVAPISHYTVGAIGGFLYGPFWGGFLNWAGRVLGHIAAFWIARRLFRPLVERYVEPETRDRFDRLIGGGRGFSVQSLILFLVYFLPLFPDDEISYIVGLSPMGFWPFLMANLFGHLGGAFSLAYIGSGIDANDPYFWFLFGVTLAGFPLIWYLIRRKELTGKPGRGNNGE